MGTEEKKLPEGRSFFSYVQIRISQKAAAEGLVFFFLILHYSSVKHLNPWIIKHNNLTFGTGQSYKESKLRRLLQTHFKILLVLFAHVFQKS